MTEDRGGNAVDGFRTPDVVNMGDMGGVLFENAGEVAIFLGNRRGGRCLTYRGI